ncbi:MAG: ferritin-like domain-containing protein [Acidimicrobiales bacterium]|nr:ferritin-like domain-containing protein [Acidimicrobiales bacterium]
MDERALRRLARDADEQHREAMQTLHNDLAQAHFGSSDEVSRRERRKFLARAAAGGAVMFGATAVPLSTLLAFNPPAAAQTTHSESPSQEDIALAQFAQSLELAAVAAYRAIDESRILSAAVGETARLFRRHHQEHADALGKILTTAGAEPATQPNAALVTLVRTNLQNARDENEVLKVAYELEEGAASTYLLAIGRFESATIAEAGATILPVESQHAVVWGQVLDLPEGDYTPAFVDARVAFDPATYPVS